MTDLITIRRPDDWHLHLRDGDVLATVLPYTSGSFGRAMVMPNLQPPVTTVEAARAYRERILAAVPAGDRFMPLMTAYLCDHTPPDELRRGHEEGVFSAVKLYPSGATTHSEFGVTDMAKVAPALECMQAIGMPLLLHGESTDPAVDVFDREAVFLERTLQPLLRDFPALKVVLEHITTEEAAQVVRSDHSGRLGATITPQHLLFNRNAIFTQGIRPHFYCLPILKRERHRLALIQVATSGDARFSWAPTRHPRARVQGIRLRLRRDLQCAHRPGGLRHGLRSGRRARSPGGLCKPQRAPVLRPLSRRGHPHPAARAASGARQRGAARRRGDPPFPGREHRALAGAPGAMSTTPFSHRAPTARSLPMNSSVLPPGMRVRRRTVRGGLAHPPDAGMSFPAGALYSLF